MGKLIVIVLLVMIAAWYAKEYVQHKNSGGSYELVCEGSGHRKNRECSLEKTYPPQPPPQSYAAIETSEQQEMVAVQQVQQPQKSLREQWREEQLKKQQLQQAYYPKQVESASGQGFSCDGRQHCSQMTSCAEATYFLRNCPNTQMDGNGDGIPCEKQWCR